jgi:hypothetical protein
MRKWSQVTLLIGLALGFVAIWAGAAPVGLTGDLVTGSWESLWCPHEWFYVGCTGDYCEPGMNGRGTTLYCYQGPIPGYTCYGGAFVGAVHQGDGYTTHADGDSWPCWAPSGYPGYNFCNFNLKEAVFY